VTGYFARVAFDLTDHDAGNLIIDRVEEGTYDAQGHWQFARVWNGDH
jgi:peptide deformylase